MSYKDAVLILGELYLKRGPHIYNGAADIEYFNDLITDIEFDASKENPNFRMLPYLDMFKEYRDALLDSNGMLYWFGTDSFWQLTSVDDTGLKLTSCEKCGDIYEETYKSTNKLDKDFIKLSQFLSKATFVGRQFRRTKPIKDYSGCDDTSYMNVSGVDICIALYCTQDLFLVKEINSILGLERYRLINSRYTLDGNYEFLGPVYEEYRDKEQVYSEILQQVTKNNRGRGKQ